MKFTNMIEVEYVTEICCQCSISFGMTVQLQSIRKKDHQLFYCPLGHGQHYVAETEAEKLKKILKNTEERLAMELSRNGRLKQDLATTRGKLTKTEKRIAKGVCPCCNRQFVNMARHMKGRHPEYTGETA